MRLLYALLLIPSLMFANEFRSDTGDRSWQFRTPSDKITLQNNISLRNAEKAGIINGTAGLSSGGGYSGSPLGGAYGNVITVYVDGDNNSVDLESSQDNTESDQTVNATVTDSNNTNTINNE